MSSEREICNSRHFKWLMKSCLPNPDNATATNTIPILLHKSSSHYPTLATTISSLPDDIVLDVLCRVPLSSFPSLNLVCRRWSRLIHSPNFSDIRRRRSLLRHTAHALAATDPGLSVATLTDGTWNASLLSIHDPVSLHNLHSLLSHARVVSVGPRIYILGRNATLRYDTWTGAITPHSAMIFQRRKFAAAEVSGKIYVAGGGSKNAAVEEYDPESDTWCVVSHAPRKRYGCIGASVGSVFYVIGGLRIDASERSELSRAGCGTEAHAAYASSMDLFDVDKRVWLRSQAVPCRGCVVAACAAAGRVYALTSHAVELSFWSFDALRLRKCGSRGSGGFGEWRRIQRPPLPTQVRVDTRMRFSCVGMGDKVVLVQVVGCATKGIVLVYDCIAEEWGRGADLPDVFRRAAFVGVER